MNQQNTDATIKKLQDSYNLAKANGNQFAMDDAAAKAANIRAAQAAADRATTLDSLARMIAAIAITNRPTNPVPSVVPAQPTVISSAVSYTPYYAPTPTYYAPPRPAPPSPPPAAPPTPGIEPQFTFETQEQLVKYEYVYGAKDIQIRGSQYANKSIYISTPIMIEGNVMQVSLNANEDHPVFDVISGQASDRHTSVEYYVTYADNPSLDEWYPILPEDQQNIKAELLMFDSARTATLRFPALTTGSSIIYKDGIKFSDWAYTGGGTKIQLSVEYATGSIYTIDYTPNADIVNPWVIDIYEHGVTTKPWVDTFPDGANHNKTLVLTKYPYIYYDKINADLAFNPNGTYTPIKVSLLDATIAGPNRTLVKQVDPYTGVSGQTIYTYNITDYKTNTWKVPKAYSLDKTTPYTVFEYWNSKNQLYFSETFNKADLLTNQEINHGNATVQVAYEYLVSNFRIKIILRRNGTMVDSVSPIVSQYSLKFKAMK